MSPKPLFAFQRTKDKALLAGVLAVPKLDLDLDTPSDQELVRSLATLLVKRSHDGRLPEHPVFVWPDGSLSPDFGSDGEGKWLNACTAVGIFTLLILIRRTRRIRSSLRLMFSKGLNTRTAEGNSQMTKTLIVTVEASTETALEDLIETLARVACDVSNSFEDENAHIFISEAATGLGAR
jgi:hypothetical protein